MMCFFTCIQLNVLLKTSFNAFFIVSSTLIIINQTHSYLTLNSFNYPTTSNTERIPFRNEVPSLFQLVLRIDKLEHTNCRAQTAVTKLNIWDMTELTFLPAETQLWEQHEPWCADVTGSWRNSERLTSLSTDTQTALPSPHTWRRRDSRDRQTTVSIPVKSGIWNSICVSAAVDRSWRTRLGTEVQGNKIIHSE